LLHSAAVLVSNTEYDIGPLGKQQVSRRACRGVRRSYRFMVCCESLRLASLNSSLAQESRI
jgi:hypothetical protein